MFTEINNITYNMYSISSFFPLDDEDKYYIAYTSVSGSVLKEEFDTEAERNTKFEELKAKFVAGSSE